MRTVGLLLLLGIAGCTPPKLPPPFICYQLKDVYIIDAATASEILQIDDEDTRLLWFNDAADFIPGRVFVVHPDMMRYMWDKAVQWNKEHPLGP